MYSEKVMEHFTNPRNVGEIPDADGYYQNQRQPLHSEVTPVTVSMLNVSVRGERPWMI